MQSIGDGGEIDGIRRVDLTADLTLDPAAAAAAEGSTAPDELGPDTHPAYVGLPAKLSRAPFTYTVVLLVFFMVRMLFFIASLQSGLESAKERIMSSCRSVESLGSETLSVPSTVAVSVNKATVTTVNAVIWAAGESVGIILEALVTLLVYFVRTFLNTLRCFLRLVVDGSLAALQEASVLLQRYSAEVTKQVADGVGQFADQVNRAWTSIPGVRAPAMPKLDASAIANVQIPNLADGVAQLTDQIPTFVGLEDQLVAYLSDPVASVSKMARDVAAGSQVAYDMLPVPAKREVWFCDTADLTAFDKAANEVLQAAWWGLWITCGAIAAATIVNMVTITWQHYRTESAIARERILENLISDDGHPGPLRKAKESSEDFLVDLAKSPSTAEATADRRRAVERHNVYVNPKTNLFAIRLSRLLFRSNENRQLLRWFIDYIFYGPALICLFVGAGGLAIIYMQRTAISMFRQHQPELAESVTDLGFLAGNKINAAVGGASQAFSASCNAVLDSQERVFNDEILSWVNRTGDVVNDTLNMALDEISKGIETTFRGSPLKAPTEDFVNCFITNRIRTVQKAIAWVQGVSHLNLPRVPEGILQIDDTTIRKYTHKMSVDLFGTDAAREQEAAAAGAEARSLRLEERDAASPGEDERGYVNRALDAYEASMAREERFFVYLAAAYGVLFGAGVLRVLHAKTMRRRGPARGWPPPLPREKSSGTAPGAQGRPARPFALSLPSIRPPRRRVARKTDKTGPPQQEVLRSAVPEEGTRALASGLPETPALRSAPLDPPALRPAGLVSTPAHPTGRARAGTKPPEPADRAEAPAAPPLPSDRRRVFGRRPHSPAAEGPGRPSPPQGSTTAAAERIAVAGSRAKEAVRAWWWSVEGLFSAAPFGPKDPGEPPPPPRSSETPAVRDVGRRQVALQAPLEPERAAGPAAKSHGGTPGRPRVDPAFGGAGLGAAEPQGRGSTQA